MTPHEVSPSRADALSWRAWLIAGIVAAVFFVSYIADNRFPDFYHTSEPLKVDQVLGAEYNLRHPLLMLNSARLMMRLTGQPPLRQNAVVTGRTCSAFYAAAAVGIFALWGFLQRGSLGAWAVGLLVGLQPGLLTAAHYLKEDPYLLFGLACTFLALVLYERRPTFARAAGLGIACALALSGKYIGVFAVVLGAILILKTAPRGQRHFLIFLAGFLLTIVLVNFQIFFSLSTLHSSVSQEVELLYLDHGEAYAVWNKTRYFEMLLETVPLIFLIGAAGMILRIVLRKSRNPLSDWMFAIVPVLYLLGLSLFPKGADRYFLPVSTLLFCLAALALCDLAEWLTKRRPALRPAAGGALLIGLALAFCWGDFRSTAREFRRDNRRSLAEWVVKNLPPQAVLATDNRVALPQPDDARFAETRNFIPQKVFLGKRFAAEIGTFEDLQKRGITHVAVAKNDYERVFRRPDLLNPEEEAKMGDYRHFYERLFAEGKQVYAIKKGRNRFLQPALEIYQIPSKS